MKQFIIRTAFVILAGLAFISFGQLLLHTENTSAANALAFDPGRIIDDAIFTNNSSMSASAIQAFFDQQNSVCLKNYTGLALIDTNGNGQVEDWTTNEQYGGSSGTQRMTAAQLIKAAGDIYGINPQVLIVTLQKEQGLITRTDCPDWRYSTAFGFGCPDTAPCDQSAYGFTRQIDNAAYHFKNYMTGKIYAPYGLGTNTINWSPKAYCGTSDVTIQTRATAALYSYTPYRPNQAALNAGYGLGDDCSAYGNRNFYLYFNDWFGSTISHRLPLNRNIGSNSLSIEQKLASGDYIVSPNGRFVMVMQPDGNLVTYYGKKAVWASNTSGQYDAYTVLQSDGNVVIYRKDGAPAWASNTMSSGANSLQLQDDGNMYIMAGTVQKYATNIKVPYAKSKLGLELNTGMTMRSGDYIQSPDNRYSLVMQPNGNLVLFSAGNDKALWSSNTYGQPGAYAVMQNDGNLVVYKANNIATWSSGTSGKL